MTVIEDREFGAVTVRKSNQSRSMKATVAPNGQLRISVPMYVPLFMVRRMIASSREELRKLLAARPQMTLVNGMEIGKSHSLLVRQGSVYSLKRTGNQLVLTIEPGMTLEEKRVIEDVRQHTLAILRREAKSHLPRRLKHLADTHGFEYSGLRFTHASSRWGSCNHKNAISLNIGLMNIPFELIDYVLIHELCHTRHLNHSKQFWDEVERIDQDYESHRKQLKAYSPGV